MSPVSNPALVKEPSGKDSIQMPPARGKVPAVLTCWKDIASYLGKSVRTVQRWEDDLDLPVRRPDAVNRNIVVAVPSELDKWVTERLQPRHVLKQVRCSPQLVRMHKLVQAMQTEILTNQERASKLIRNFEKTRTLGEQQKAKK